LLDMMLDFLINYNIKKSLFMAFDWGF